MCLSSVRTSTSQQSPSRLSQRNPWVEDSHNFIASEIHNCPDHDLKEAAGSYCQLIVAWTFHWTIFRHRFFLIMRLIIFSPVQCSWSCRWCVCKRPWLVLSVAHFFLSGLHDQRLRVSQYTTPSPGTKRKLRYARVKLRILKAITTQRVKTFLRSTKETDT